MIKISPDQLDLHLNYLRPAHAKNIEQMTASLMKYGQLSPVIAVDDKDRMTLIDGFKRLRCAKQIGMKTLWVSPVTKSRSESKALIYLLNRSKSFSMITEAILIRDLIEVEGLNQTEAGVLLDRHKTWICRRLSMIRNLAPQVVDDIKLNLLPAGAGPSLALLPRGNQADFTVAIQKHKLKSREIRQLVNIWRKAKDPQTRQCILASPRESLEIIKKDNTQWRVLIECALLKISTLNRVLEQEKPSMQDYSTFNHFVGRLQHQMTKLEDLAAGVHHEPIN
jgi:hypothetical protein